MKNFYLAVTIEKNGKYYSTIERVSTSDNVVSFMQRKNYKYVNICESKKKAEDLAESWNDSYKATGIYLFD